MVRTFRWLLRLFLALAALLALAGLAAWHVASRSLIDYGESFTVAGVDALVEIVRDNSAVPHIFGHSDADSFFGLGFVHAQDRLWQMTLLRRQAQGRMAELFGPQELARDELMRSLDLYGRATRSVAAQDSYTQAALQAYSAGVNAWLREVSAGGRGRGAPEFFLFTRAIAPWQPADSIAVMKLLAWQQSDQAAAEVRRALAAALLPPERLADLLPDVPGPGLAALPVPPPPAGGAGGLLAPPSEDGAAPPDPRAPGGLSPDGMALDGLGSPAEGSEPGGPAPAPPGGGSNAWAAGPSRSASGSTLLAADPHLAFTAPSLWYLARLELHAGGVIGATIPGIPAVLQGRSQRLGWGMATAHVDDADLHLEAPDPDDPTRVRTPEGWTPFARRASIIEVKGAPPVTLEVLSTPNGPLLPAAALGAGVVTPPGQVMSLSWTGLSEADTTLSSALALMRAGSVAEGVAAGAGWVAPGMNVVLADRRGIGMKTFGAIPARDAAHQSQGRIPSPGWIEANLWQGVHDPASNPGFLDPEGGIVGSTNGRLPAEPFPEHVSFLWGDSQRVLRWERLMQIRQVHTRESFIEAQLDTVSPTARTLLPLVAADLWFTGEAAPEGSSERLRQRALALLAEWNGEMNEHLPEPLIYAAWMQALQQRLIRDELGPLAREFTRLEPLFIERVFTDAGGAAVWCDIIQSAKVETCTEIAQMALDDALVWISQRQGRDPASWRWGDLHEAQQDHPTLGSVPLLRFLVNIRQSTSGGDNTLAMGRIAGSGDNPYRSIAGPGYRGVYDFADPDSSVFVISTGESGHPLSRHYDDLGTLWRRGEYVPMSLDPQLARAAAVGITTLRPADR